MNVLRAAGGLTVLVLGIFMTMMFLRDRKRSGRNFRPAVRDAKAR